MTRAQFVKYLALVASIVLGGGIGAYLFFQKSGNFGVLIGILFFMLLFSILNPVSQKTSTIIKKYKSGLPKKRRALLEALLSIPKTLSLIILGAALMKGASESKFQALIILLVVLFIFAKEEFEKQITKKNER